ncbi:MAG: GIY-YIG nuclease family protein [Selenomonadaceae bacterium]|nr:GIY-YIG nuclease family protein [Selenomonadaceae bacterium]
MNHTKKDAESQIVFFDVYVLWCKKNNMHYVGVTQQKVTMRIRQHRRGKQFVDKQIQEIGWENWDWWVVEENVPSNRITEREQYWVGVFNSVYPNGYNKTIGGIKYFRHSKKTCEQMGKSHLGKKRAPFTEEHKANISKAMSGENHPNYGKPARNRGIPCPEETKRKIRKKLTGRKRPDQSERMKGENNPNFGKPMPEKTKSKLREKALARDMSGENNPMYGKHHTEESIEAMRQAHLGNSAHKGKHHTEETKTILREKALARDMRGENNPFYGRKHTEETKAKLREKTLARHAAKRAAQETP